MYLPFQWVDECATMLAVLARPSVLAHVAAVLGGRALEQSVIITKCDQMLPFVTSWH